MIPQKHLLNRVAFSKGFLFWRKEFEGHIVFSELGDKSKKLLHTIRDDEGNVHCLFDDEIRHL